MFCLLPESFNEYNQFIPFVYIFCTAKGTTQEKGNKTMQLYARLRVLIYYTVYADRINNSVSPLFTYSMCNVLERQKEFPSVQVLLCNQLMSSAGSLFSHFLVFPQETSLGREKYVFYTVYIADSLYYGIHTNYMDQF